jgi:2-amino-4-hydroxy-6-hydroxymethyldihydropteridine diphosphokinase/dihydropteroate synthase
MVILGLGSNEGHCLTHCRRALNALREHPQINVLATSPVYHSDALMPEHAPAHWNKPYLNAAVSIATSLGPDALVSELKHIERQLGREQKAHWAPRVVDIDLLIYHDQVLQTDHCTVPHPGLLERPFALWPLLDLLPHWRIPPPGRQHGQMAAALTTSWGDRFSGLAPFRTRQIPHRIDTAALMGIVNISPDSFSDGQTRGLDDVLAHAQQLAQDGAEVIDIGAESTRPSAVPLSAAAHWQRLQPVLHALTQQHESSIALRPQISIDCYHPEIIERCFDYPIDWINDVSGCAHRAIPDAPQTLRWVMMRPRSIPCPAHLAANEFSIQWAKQQLQQLPAWLSAEQIILDPGIGFGTSAAQSWQLIAHLAEWRALPCAILLGHSRKSFLGTCTHAHPQARDPATLAVSLACQQDVDYLRVHDVAMHAQAMQAQAQLIQQKTHTGRSHEHLAATH